jgi:hypothetical protein
MLAQDGHEPRPSMPVVRSSPASAIIRKLDTHHNKHWPGRNPMKWQCRVFCEGCDVNSHMQMCCVPWHFVWTEIILWITTQKRWVKGIFSSVVCTDSWSLDHRVSKEHGYSQVFFFSRNLYSPFCSKDITEFLRHTKQCLFYSPHSVFCFTYLSHLILEIFRFFKKHVQNLNTPTE